MGLMLILLPTGISYLKTSVGDKRYIVHWLLKPVWYYEKISIPHFCEKETIKNRNITVAVFYYNLIKFFADLYYSLERTSNTFLYKLLFPSIVSPNSSVKLEL